MIKREDCCIGFHAHSGVLSAGELWKLRVISCKPKKLDTLQKETPSRPESRPPPEVERGKAACLDRAGSADTLAWDQTSRGGEHLPLLSRAPETVVIWSRSLQKPAKLCSPVFHHPLSCAVAGVADRERTEKKAGTYLGGVFLSGKWWLALDAPWTLCVQP